MKLLDINVEGFGKLTDRQIVFDEKMNIIHGFNEAGKSTLHALIRAMLFGMRRARGAAAQTDTYMHYKPWSGARYKAAMRIEYGGRVYKIIRDFDESPVRAVVIDEASGQNVSDTGLFFKKILSGITENSYDNTISVGQLKSASGSEMSEELKNFIVNMDTTGNRSLNAENAKTYLYKQRDELSAQLVPDTGKRINQNLAEIKKLEAELEDPRYVSRVRELNGQIENITDISGEDYLKENNFKKAEEVDCYTRTMQSMYEAYKKEEAEGRKKRSATATVLLIIFCALLVGAAVYEFMYGTVLIALICAGAALVVFLIFCIVNDRRIHAKKALAKKKEAADEFVTKITGVDGLDDEKLEAAKKKLSDIRTVAIAVEDRNQQYEYQDILTNKLMRLKQLKDDNEFLERAKRENDTLNFNIQAIDIALETIDELSETQKNSAGLFLNKEASENVRAITEGAYTSMSISNDLNVYLNTKEKMVPIQQVSSGTQDQIYLAVRLACAKLMQNGKENLPLIFDDSFVNYDENRLDAAIRWMNEAYAGQKLVFTCHTSEQAALDKAGIAYNLLEL